MKIRTIKIVSLVFALSVMLISCKSTRHYQREERFTQDIFGMESDASGSMAEMPWEQLITDANLQTLIQEGFSNNLDLKMAVENIIQSEAYLSQSKASLLPGINAVAKDSYTRNPESLYPSGPREVNNYQLGAEASWEIDIWGKLRGAKRAAYANLLYSDAGVKAVQTRLVANISTTYYSLLALDTQLSITKQTVENNIALVATMKALKESGRVTSAAIVQSEAARYAAEVTLPDLEQRIRETENVMCLLLGRSAGNVERQPIKEMVPSQMLKVGVPSQILDNRPDVMQAEYSVISAYEITNSAKAYFYPALTLTASAGFAASDLDELLDPVAFAANVLGGLSAPLFNKRANVTRLKVSKSQRETALLALKNTLLNAGVEVNNAFGSYEAARKKSIIRTKQIVALERSVEFTKELLTYGAANYTEVLSAQQNLLSAQLGKVNDQLQQQTAVVALYRALGGGWR